MSLVATFKVGLGNGGKKGKRYQKGQKSCPKHSTTKSILNKEINKCLKMTGTLHVGLRIDFPKSYSKRYG